MTMLEKYRQVLGRHGVKHILAVLVLLAMHEYGLSYHGAVEAVAAFYNDAPEREHSRVCYWLLAAGIEEPAPGWFKKRVREVENFEEEMEYENGIYAE